PSHAVNGKTRERASNIIKANDAPSTSEAPISHLSSLRLWRPAMDHDRSAANLRQPAPSACGILVHSADFLVPPRARRNHEIAREHRCAPRLEQERLLRHKIRAEITAAASQRGSIRVFSICSG